MTKGSEEDVTFTQKLQSRMEAQQCVTRMTLVLFLGLSLIRQMSVSIITKIQPGSRKLYIKYFLMSTEGFFSLLLLDIYTSRMPQLEATLKICKQYFFDICHTHFRTVLSKNTSSWIIYWKTTSFSKEMVIMETWQFFGFVTLMKPVNMLRQVQARIGKEKEWYSRILSVLQLLGFSTW